MVLPIYINYSSMSSMYWQAFSLEEYILFLLLPYGIFYDFIKCSTSVSQSAFYKIT